MISASIANFVAGTINLGTRTGWSFGPFMTVNPGGIFSGDPDGA
jgi:hypothetical protein